MDLKNEMSTVSTLEQPVSRRSFVAAATGLGKL